MLKRFGLLFLICLPLSLLSQVQFKMIGEPVKLIGVEGQYFTNPVWSPDGNKIAFSGSNYKSLWVINQDGTSLINLSEESSSGFGFQWSDDSKEILTTVTKFNGAYRSSSIKIFDCEQKTEKVLTGYRKNIPAISHWTADNSQVYYYSGKNLEFVNTGKQLKITTFKPLYFIKHGNLYTQIYSENLISSERVLVNEECLNVKISPNGNNISYEVLGGNLFVVNSDGSNRIDLGRGYRASWSPDSEYLVYLISEDDGHQLLSSDLYISHRNGSDKIQLTDSELDLEINPGWSPDGQKIVYSNDLDGAIYLISIQR